jgi:hypothetical protein
VPPQNIEKQGSSLAPTLLASIIVGGIAGYLDLQYDNLAITLVAVLIGTLILGFFAFDRWWLTSLVAGLGVLAAHLIQSELGSRTSTFEQPDVLASLLSLMPAFVGGLAGAAIRQHPEQRE